MKPLYHHRFKTGKYQNKTYLEIWNQNPDYLYWMADNFKGGFWKQVVEQLEAKDKKEEKHKNLKFPSIDQVKQIFLSNPICGFDMSDYICDLYKSCPDDKKNNYFQSLLLRNNIHLK